MESIKDCNRKQYQIIIERINWFEKGILELTSLIDDLESLQGYLQEVDKKWRSEFYKDWGLLEEIYSVAVVENEPISTSDREKIAQSVKNLKKLAEDALNEYLEQPDPLILNTAAIIDDEWLMCSNCTDSWKCTSNNAMVICPACNEALHNPRYHIESA